jgi:hypothetical protein
MLGLILNILVGEIELCFTPGAQAFAARAQSHFLTCVE